MGEETLQREYQRLVEGLRRVREEREADLQLANPGINLLSSLPVPLFILI